MCINAVINKSPADAACVEREAYRPVYGADGS